ncbi:MAG: ATP synthase F1 subunit gamma [Deltaproteobacteria bacterium]|nr:ATP synthase F1 subunit gamma [Deltaproteobacteria bacterium]
MANLKDIRNRIGSVNKTKQITSAMKLVAAAKLRKATARALGARPYQEQLQEVLGRVAAKVEVASPLLRRPERVQRVLLVVVTSDRGLCGAFNSNLLRKALAWRKEQLAAGREVEIFSYGRKAASFFSFHKVAVARSVVGYDKIPKMDLVRELSDLLVTGFAEGAYDEVHVASNAFVNVLVQRPGMHRVLPLELTALQGDAQQVEHEYEPSGEQIMEALLPLYLRTLLLQAFLETEAGELAARMTAMAAATKNASELISNLTLQYNRARQAAITSEIIEIVSGAEAL